MHESPSAVHSLPTRILVADDNATDRLLLSSIVKPVDNLCIIFLPATALFLLLDTLMPHTYILPQDMGVGLRLHILLSVCAYSLLCIAAVQSVVLAFQEHQLHSKHPRRSLRLLPPMQSMEDLLVQLIALGFFLLSLSVSSGFASASPPVSQ